jgi:DNA-binding transcriptional LysR family regulator
MLDLRRLKVLCEVARHGSFSAAADALGYTQPAVSRQIATLEAEVGAVLVRRAPQGAVLTDAGRLLVDRAESLIAQLASVEVELEALAGLEGGHLRLASFASGAASIVPLAIAEFRARHPAVEISIQMADPGDSLPLLRAGELDIALSHDAMNIPRGDLGTVTLAATEEHPSAEAVAASRSQVPGADGEIRSIDAYKPMASAAGLEIVPLFEDPMYVALPKGHSLADVEPLALECFAEEAWMLATTNTCPDSRLFLRACHAAGFEPRIAFQNDDYPAILGFVAAGVGVALVPDMVARGVRDDVVIRELDPPPPSRPIMAVLPAGYRSPAAAAMLEVLAEVGRRWVAERPVLSPA